MTTIAAALFLAAPLTSRAQTVVHDPTNFGGILKQIFTQITNHRDNVELAADEIEELEEVITQTTKVADGLNEVYSKVQPILSKTSVLYDAGQDIQDSYNALAYNYQAYANLFNDGKLTYDELHRALSATNRSAMQLKKDYDMVNGALQSAMTAKEKLDIIREARANAKARAERSRKKIQHMMDSICRAQNSAYMAETISAFNFGTGVSQADPSRAAIRSTDWESYLDTDPTGDYTLDQAESETKSQSRGIVGLISLILGILFIISLAWGGAKYFKGDPQNRDVLFKIAGGLFFVIILLQLISTLLF